MANNEVLKQLVNKIRGVQQELKPDSKSMRGTLYRIALGIQNRVKLEIRRQKLIDTGRLINSIQFQIEQRNETATIVVGSFGVIYAAIHEFGGEIRPKNAKALAIPMGKGFKGKSPRRFSNLQVVSTDGKGFLVDNSTNPSTFAYALRKSVRIPARPYLRPGFEKAQPMIQKALRDYARSLRGL